VMGTDALLGAAAFDEVVGAYVVECNAATTVAELSHAFTGVAGVTVLGVTQSQSRIEARDQQIDIAALTQAWRGTLDW